MDCFNPQDAINSCQPNIIKTSNRSLADIRNSTS
uniref:Uncharacterized protein n=1 Tax=Rhizophora mucronata TaxID=61149 RepID=A0A2P2QA50_RHIMU